ncbi:hypothetical protein M8C13_04585 [Crossiella sp. SN42]|uniref:hypothetical protein n=1 Tax=Crossiella sp. SN42 TaxID=2944808 RepID=UPI00207C7930|nr:hypothetical protein [Crossiella sp. SN42]MCO1575036.1 hypothetical protein [Crossiella sp. SN42]
MVLPIYTYTVADTRTGVTGDELPLTGVKYSKILNGSGAFSGTLPLGSPEVQRLDPYELTTPAHQCIYVWRDGRPVWGGIIWTRRYSKSSNAIEVQAGDFLSYFDRRKLLHPLTSEAYSDALYVPGLSLSWAAVDQNQIMRELIDNAQAHTGGDVDIAFDLTVNTGVFRDRTYYGYELVDVGEALRQLSTVIGGSDFRFDVDFPDSNGKVVRRLILGDPLLGQAGSPWVFELGANILDYTWPSDGTRMATRTFAVGQGQEKDGPIAVAENLGRYVDGWPLLESETSYSTVLETSTLYAHAQADQELARLPVALPTLVVRGDADPAVTDYSPGDDARVIIRDDFFTGSGLDTRMRIVSIEVAPGEKSEEVTLTMSPMLEDVA